MRSAERTWDLDAEREREDDAEMVAVERQGAAE